MRAMDLLRLLQSMPVASRSSRPSKIFRTRLGQCPLGLVRPRPNHSTLATCRTLLRNPSEKTHVLEAPRSSCFPLNKGLSPRLIVVRTRLQQSQMQARPVCLGKVRHGENSLLVLCHFPEKWKRDSDATSSAGLQESKNRVVVRAYIAPLLTLLSPYFQVPSRCRQRLRGSS